MLLSYFKLSLRLMARNPLFTTINVIGLAIGFAVFFVLLTYTRSELATDRFHPDWNRIVRVGAFVEWTDDNKTWESNKYGFSPAVVPGHLGDVYSEIESIVRIVPQWDFRYYNTEPGNEITVSHIHSGGEKKSFREENIIYADPNLFQFFSIPLIRGDARSVLTDAGSILLSRTKARNYFGSDDPVGKSLLLNDSLAFTVTGVFEDLPSNTHLNFDIILSTERIKKAFGEWRWRCLAFSYAKTKPGVDIHDLQKRINTDLKEFIRHAMWGDWMYGKAQIRFQKLDEAAFGHFMWDTHTPKSKLLLNALGAATWVVLAMAWINYIIHTVTFNFRRDKEQNIRRIVGASTTQIAYQFLVESVLTHAIALLASFTLVQAAQTLLTQAFGFYIPSWQVLSVSTKVMIIGTVLLSICLTTILPFLNTWIRVKQKRVRIVGTRDVYYNGLTSLQFALAIVLVTCTFCVYEQNRFILQKDIGLNRTNILVIELPPAISIDFNIQVRSLVNQIKSFQGVHSATVSHSIAGNNFQYGISLQRPGAEGGGLNVESDGGVDANFIPFYNITLSGGRNFIEDNPADSNTIILSVAAAKRLGFENPEKAIGQKIGAGWERWGENVEVIGIINDYQMRPLISGIHSDASYSGVPGLALTYKDFAYANTNPQTVSVRINPGSETETIAAIEEIYQKTFPSDSEFFRYNFLDDKINSQYQNYKTLLNQITLFAMLAISVAVAGLIGVFARKIAVRVKEIGIRKVLGADGANLIRLLTGSTLRQFILASSVGLISAWLLNRRYQQEFTEHAEMTIWSYLFPVFLFAAIISVTIGSTIWRAVQAKPVDALKHE